MIKIDLKKKTINESENATRKRSKRSKNRGDRVDPSTPRGIAE